MRFPLSDSRVVVIGTPLATPLRTATGRVRPFDRDGNFPAKLRRQGEEFAAQKDYECI